MISQCIQQMAMKILKENPNIANSAFIVRRLA